MDWLDLLTVQGTLKSLLQHHSSKASVFQCSTFFMFQLSHPYMTAGKIITLTIWTFVGKVMSLLFNMLSRLEKEMAAHSSTLAWKIPWTEKPGRLQSMGSQRVGHDWVTSLSLSMEGELHICSHSVGVYLQLVRSPDSTLKNVKTWEVDISFITRSGGFLCYW